MRDLPLIPGRSRSLSVVYYLRRSDRAVKIGWSTCAPRRIDELRRTHGSLELIAWEPGNRILEQQRHREFADARIDYRYEWFKYTAQLKQHVAGIRSELDEAVELWGPAMMRNAGLVRG